MGLINEGNMTYVLCHDLRIHGTKVKRVSKLWEGTLEDSIICHLKWFVHVIVLPKISSPWISPFHSFIHICRVMLQEDQRRCRKSSGARWNFLRFITAGNTTFNNYIIFLSTLSENFPIYSFPHCISCILLYIFFIKLPISLFLLNLRTWIEKYKICSCVCLRAYLRIKRL